MEKNAIINSRLKDLLDVMDARAYIEIYTEDGKERTCSLRVYDFLTEPVLMNKYRNYEVVGLVCGLSTRILVKEA